MMREAIGRSGKLVVFILAAGGTACQGAQQNYGSHGDASTDTDIDTDADSDTDIDSDSETVDTDFTSDAIPETCAEAAENPTSVGCEFFGVDLDNGDDSEFTDSKPYAIVVSNPQEEQSVNISLWNGAGSEIYSTTLEPGHLEVINVTCSAGCLEPPNEIQIQGLARGAGFRLTSDAPVIAYQWNPYGTEGFSTDASLLLPATSLSHAYTIAAWGFGPEENLSKFRSQLVVVATQDNTAVSFVPSTDVPDLGDAGPYSAGEETDSILLNAMDVIALSPSAWNDDLTGTTVEANKPVAVFGGHTCALVPTSDYAACDHVEEQLIPLAAWGTNAVLARYAPREDCAYDDLAVWRIVAGAEGITVTFDPPAPAPAGSEHYFERQGEVLEFLAPDDYYAEGFFEIPENPDHPEAPFLAYQMMTGGRYPLCPVDGPDTGTEGDPMMLLAPPAGQYLDRYVFNTDNVYDFDYDSIIVIRPVGSHVVLDCKGLIPDFEFTEVGSSGYEVARIFIDNMDDTTGCIDGVHLLTASAPVGLSVVGTARDNSYGYLGGVGVKPINPVVVE